LIRLTDVDRFVSEVVVDFEALFNLNRWLELSENRPGISISED